MRREQRQEYPFDPAYLVDDGVWPLDDFTDVVGALLRDHAAREGMICDLAGPAGLFV